ncbi:MAG: hypothetical protein FWF29_02430 [Treponema sp.]|nr:hypothetical protein [Treponema sp.]
MAKLDSVLKIIVLCLFTALIASCPLPQHTVGGITPAAGMGTVNLSIAGTGARTILPTGINDLVYSVVCTAGDETVNVTLENGSGSIPLKADVEWTITINATDPGNGGLLVGNYIFTVTLIDGESKNYNNIYLQPVTGEGIDNGTLVWSVSFPADGSVASATLSCTGLDTPIDLLGKDGNSGTMDLAPGSYIFRAELLGKDGRSAGNTEAVHIYSGMTTNLDWTFTSADFATTMNVDVSVDITPSPMITIDSVTLKSADFGAVTGVKTGATWNFVISGVSLDAYNVQGLWLVIETDNNAVSTTAANYVISSGNDITLEPVPLYALSLLDCDNGTLGMAITGNGYSQINSDAVQADLLGGESVTVTAAPAAGYAWTGFSADGITAGSVNPWTFTMPASDVTVTAVFRQEGEVGFSVKVDANFDGFPASYPDDDSISLSKASGDTKDITLTAGSDFSSIAWYIDGSQVIASSGDPIDPAFTLSTGSLLIGKHNLSVVVGMVNGMQYSKTASFMVTR